jgi:hypothetical protein
MNQQCRLYNNNNNRKQSHVVIVSTDEKNNNKPWLMRLGGDGKVADGRNSGGNVFAIDIETQRPCRIGRLGRDDFEAVLHFGPVKTKTKKRKRERYKKIIWVYPTHRWGSTRNVYMKVFRFSLV